MEVLYGVILLITFILGLGIGISIPFFVKKYIKQAKEELKENEKPIEVSETSKIDYLPKDLLTEWITGEEAKPNEQ